MFSFLPKYYIVYSSSPPLLPPPPPPPCPPHPLPSPFQILHLLYFFISEDFCFCFYFASVSDLWKTLMCLFTFSSVGHTNSFFFFSLSFFYIYTSFFHFMFDICIYIFLVLSGTNSQLSWFDLQCCSAKRCWYDLQCGVTYGK